MGVIEFGEAEIYKEFEVRVAKARGIMDRTFHLELGNVERATNDMTRQFETQVKIRPYTVSYSPSLESCNHCGRITETNDSYTFLEYTTDSDSDSYIEDSYVSALEQSQVKNDLFYIRDNSILGRAEFRRIQTNHSWRYIQSFQQYNVV